MAKRVTDGVFQDVYGVWWARHNGGKKVTPNTNANAWELYRQMMTEHQRVENEGHLNGLEVLVLRGLPGSGKTTWARTWIEKYPWYVRICKDDLRAMLNFSHYNSYTEKVVREVQYRMIRTLLQEAGPVIIDSTNVDERHIRNMKDYAYISGKPTPVFVVDFTTPIRVCIERDAERPKPVGAERIRELNEQLTVCRKRILGLTVEQWEAKDAERSAD